MRSRKMWRSAYQSFRLWIAGEITYREYRQDIIDVCVNGDFEWKSLDAERIYLWFLSE